MSSQKKHRIQFFSKEDGVIPFQLKNAEEVLDNFQEDKLHTLNDLFEYYNIKLYFDNELYLLTWDEKRKQNFNRIVNKAFEILKQRIIEINDGNLESELKSIDFEYFENFWELINQFKVYNKIDGKIFLETLKNNKRQIRYILAQKGIVDKFDKKIKIFLLQHEDTAEILLSKLEEEHSLGKSPQYYFPRSLSLADKEQIINSYLESDKPNLNYVRLIENSKDSNDLKLSAKTRLKAKKKSTELNNEILKNGYIQNIRIQVGLSKDQFEPVIKNQTSDMFEIIYSEIWLDILLSKNIELLPVFSKLFIFLDQKNLVALVSKTSELDTMEQTLMKSKNAYEDGIVFMRKEFLSNSQLIIFEYYLKQNNNSIENIINSFIDYLNTLISPNRIEFKIKYSESPYIEKIRNLFPEYEFLLKQYKLFIDEKEIDLELIQINSTPISLSEIHSLNEKKYAYINNDLILNLKNYFYSNQSLLHYVEPYKNKYNSLYELLINENIKLDNFKNYQIRIIEKLIDEKYLKIDNQGFVKLYNKILIFIIGELHHNEVLNYWNYSKEVRDEIDILLDKDLLKFENTLFTIQERKYFNYYLNKKEFTNGYDLRNKYLHGTNSFSENEHRRDYYFLLKIIILTLLKMEDDILIYNRNK